MKQHKLHILSFFLLLYLASTMNLFSQLKLSSVSLENIYQPSPSSVQFDLVVRRISDDWSNLANGTFEFCLDTNLYRDYANTIDIELLKTELPQNVSAGDLLPTNGYIIDIFKYDTRIAITALGPPDYLDCIYVPRDTFILVGTFLISSKDGSALSSDLSWMKPVERYQALAYKTDVEVNFSNKSVLRYYANDNIPMIDDNTGEYRVNYLIDHKQPFEYVLDYFNADYAGQRAINLTWATLSEVGCVGYTILRYPDLNMPNPSKDTVFTYRKGTGYFDPEMYSKGVSKSGFPYGPLVDKLKYNGGRYCYELYATLFTGEQTRDSLVGRDCADLPILLIGSAEPDQNPFSYSTTITYELLDDAYVSVIVYDEIGKKLFPLSDAQSDALLDGSAELKRGFHQVRFTPDHRVAMGMYNIVIRGIPIDNANEIEEGYVDVKVQYIK